MRKLRFPQRPDASQKGQKLRQAGRVNGEKKNKTKPEEKEESHPPSEQNATKCGVFSFAKGEQDCCLALQLKMRLCSGWCNNPAWPRLEMFPP